MEISVVVLAYNNREVLRTALARLAAQDFPRDAYEVIVSDDGSTDGTAEMLRFRSIAAAEQCRHTVHRDETHRYGLEVCKFARGIGENDGKALAGKLVFRSVDFLGGEDGTLPGTLADSFVSAAISSHLADIYRFQLDSPVTTRQRHGRRYDQKHAKS